MPPRQSTQSSTPSASRLLLPALVACAWLGTAPTQAQEGGLGSRDAVPKVTLKEPVAGRVYQRDKDGAAEVNIVLDEAPEGAKIVSAWINNAPMNPNRFRDGKLIDVPTGGPYQVGCDVKIGDAVRRVSCDSIYVGDLWVLAGQSNMEGVGDLSDETPPNERVRLLGMDGRWSMAEEPLHWLVDSPDPVHSGDPKTREERAKSASQSRRKGAGLGLPFAVVLAGQTNVPIGLVACAHGGTSMEQWSPAKKDQGGDSLYGSMIRQVKLAGGKVKGVLWYQGESDASVKAAAVYPKVFADFITAVRSDFGQPELPFYLVQIGRVIRGGEPKEWNDVREAQRLIPERVPYTAVASVMDLELDDGIHVGTAGLKRLGVRLARIALREQFGQEGAATPTFDKVSKGEGNTLIVKFRDVNRLHSQFFQQPMQLPGFNGAFLLSKMDQQATQQTPLGLKPARHIAGFSIRKADGADVPLIFEAMVGTSRESVVLKLTGPVPEDAFLWYGWGFDPYCNLVDGLDMAVPAFGPISLKDAR